MPRSVFFARESTDRRNSTRRLLALGSIAVVGWIAGCQQSSPPVARPEAVATIRLAPETVTESLTYGGVVRERHRQEVSFKIAGTVASLHETSGPDGRPRQIQAGDMIRGGEILATLDPVDYRRALSTARERLALAEARLQAAKAELLLATNERARVDSLLKSRVAARSEWDNVKAREDAAAAAVTVAEREIDTAKIAVEQAEADLADCVLEVPFDQATVAQRRIEKNQRVAAQQSAFELIDISSVLVRIAVPDLVVGRLALGVPVTIRAEAFPGRLFSAVVWRIAASADPATGTFGVDLVVNRPDGLRVGMVVTAELSQPRREVLIPLTAIVRGDTPESIAVFGVLRDGAKTWVDRRMVNVIGVLDNRAAIQVASSPPTAPSASQSNVATMSQELCLGEEVVIAGASRLANGQAVEVR